MAINFRPTSFHVSSSACEGLSAAFFAASCAHPADVSNDRSDDHSTCKPFLHYLLPPAVIAKQRPLYSFKNLQLFPVLQTLTFQTEHSRSVESGVLNQEC